MGLYSLENNKAIPRVIITTLTGGGRSKTSVDFVPYDFEFDDNFKPEWNPYDAFGRMDPIMVYKRTTRDANLSFNVVADNPEIAIENFKNLQTLISFLYPVYGKFPSTQQEAPSQPQSAEAQLTTVGPGGPGDSQEPGQIIQQSPLMTISFMNLLKPDTYVIAVTNFKHKLNFEMGSTSLKEKVATPGKFNISISFKILHTKNMDFKKALVY